METKIEAMQIFTCEKEGVPLHWKENAQFAFLEGVRFAEEWISVDDEIPKRIDNKFDFSHPVLVMNDIGEYDVRTYSYFFNSFKPLYDSEIITHWRPINRK